MKAKFIFPLLLAFVTLNAFGQAKPKKVKDKILVGKTYTVEISQTGTKKPAPPEPDEISFKGGKLTSKVVTTKYKYPAGDYLVTSVDSAENYVEINFSSESQNMDGETIKWEGNVTDQAIEGRAVVTNKKGKVLMEFGFSGSEKEKKGAKK